VPLSGDRYALRQIERETERKSRKEQQNNSIAQM